MFLNLNGSSVTIRYAWLDIFSYTQYDFVKKSVDFQILNQTPYNIFIPIAYIAEICGSVPLLCRKMKTYRIQTLSTERTTNQRA